MAFLASLASSALGAFFKGLFDAVLTYVQQRQVHADTVDLGQQRQLNADTVAALKVQNEMRHVAVQPHDVAAAIGALNAGTF